MPKKLLLFKWHQGEHTGRLHWQSGRVPLGSSRLRGLKTSLPLQTTISGNRIPKWPFSIRWFFLIPPPRITLERSWNLLAQKPLPLLLRAAVESCVQLSSTTTAVSSSPRWDKAWTLCKSTPSRRRRWQKARAARRRILSSGCSRRRRLCARVPGKPKDHRYLSAVGGVEKKPLGRYHSNKKSIILRWSALKMHSFCFFVAYLVDPYIAYTFSALAAGAYPARPSVPFDLRAHVVVDHRHGDGIQRLIVSCVWTDMQRDRVVKCQRVLKNEGPNNGSNAKNDDMGEGRQYFWFPPIRTWCSWRPLACGSLLLAGGSLRHLQTQGQDYSKKINK